MQSWGYDVIVFGAHPDDAEIGAGGMIAQEVRLGRKVMICDLTAGEMSSNGNAILRRAEALASSEVLGVSERLCLGFPDRGLRECEDQISEIVRVIREFRPRVVFTPWHGDDHPDHVHATRLVRAAVLNARLRRYGSTEPWIVERVWEYFIHEMPPSPLFLRLNEEDGIVKQKALRCYVSQFQEGEDTMSTRLQGLPLRLELRDRYAGSRVGAPWAEGFWQIEPLGFHDIWNMLD
jgi:bacillithiol biosynthesis deacetylase BshB1